MRNTLCLIGMASMMATSEASAAMLYVSLGATNPVPPYVSWESAATNIQDAIDSAGTGDAIILNNGVYPGGVAVTKAVNVLSANGPLFTAIGGGGTNWCVSLTNSASLSGLTVTNGFGVTGGVSCASTNAFLTNCIVTGNIGADGGGVYGGTLYDCMLINNIASGGSGGGAYGSILYHCTLTDNAGTYGGAASRCILYDCAVSNNWTWDGGSGANDCTVYRCALVGNKGAAASVSTLYDCTLTGNEYGVANSTLYNCTLTGNMIGAAYSTLNNCIVYFNTETNYEPFSTLNYCCTTPMPNGKGSITNAPLLIADSGGNLRLQSNSPCINAGNNAYVATTTDMDGRTRVFGAAVDIGAYEFNPGASGEFIGWLQHYGLPTEGSADFSDFDKDGLNNWEEWRCQTIPTNAMSALRLVGVKPTGTNVTITWQSVAGLHYSLERATDVTRFLPVATGIMGQVDTTAYVDTNSTPSAIRFYRVAVIY